MATAANGPENISIILIHYAAGLGVGVFAFPCPFPIRRRRSWATRSVNTHFIGHTAHKHDAARALRAEQAHGPRQGKIDTHMTTYAAWSSGQDRRVADSEAQVAHTNGLNHMYQKSIIQMNSFDEFNLHSNENKQSLCSAAYFGKTCLSPHQQTCSKNN